MPKIKPISGKKLVKILNELDFSILRISGSHFFMYHSQDGRRTTIPVHKNEEVAIGTLRKILSDIKLSVDEYHDLLKK
jgi:predicted RNA binding protein YcfA (HicA-like mRNA interferase family)